MPTPVTVLDPSKQAARAPATPAPTPAEPIVVQGMSPVMMMAIKHQQAHACQFDAALMAKLRDTLLAAVNPLGDEHGFSLEDLSLQPSDDGGAHLTMNLSTIDAMGMDRPARLLLERAEAADMTPAMLGGRIVTAQSGGREELIITGLLEWPRGYVVRLYNLTKDELCHAPAKLVAKLYRHQHR